MAVEITYRYHPLIDDPAVCAFISKYATWKVCPDPEKWKEILKNSSAGISAFITGLLAIVKQKENGLLVYVSTVIGGLLMLYLVVELAFPH
jgi:hypothetical protein